MDIEILLILQELRDRLGYAGEWIAINLSDALAAVAIVIPFITFWCLNKKRGQLMLAVFAGSLMINQILKLACAVYRPWIKDERVQPGKMSLRSATGYSFPSSHTQVAATAYGDLGIETAKTSKKMSIFWFSLILWEGFLRVFLGVHTPQDVLVGMISAFVMIPVCSVTFRWLARDRKIDIWFAAAYTVYAAVSIIWALNKPYPMDTVNGVLLVDPENMVKDFMLSCGLSYGIVMGGILEHTFIGFGTECEKKQKLLRALIGLSGAGVIYLATRLSVPLLGALYNSLLRGFLIGLWAVFLTPLIFTKLEKKN